MRSKRKTSIYCSGQQVYSYQESNLDLLFRRELFYPLNYKSIKKTADFHKQAEYIVNLKSNTMKNPTPCTTVQMTNIFILLWNDAAASFMCVYYKNIIV